MALRLRRGTNAERQLITPKAGELIYTTDTKALYIGDGTTAGGVVVQGAGGGGSNTLAGLTDTNFGSLTNGQVLAYDSTQTKWVATSQAAIAFGPVNQHTDILDDAPGPGDILLHDGSNWAPTALVDSQIRLSIVSSDSSLLVDHVNSLITGDVTGDLKDTTSTTLIDTSLKTAYGLAIKHANGTTAYDPTTRGFFGDTQGNHQGDLYSSVSSGTVKLLDSNSGQFFGDIVAGDYFSSDSTRIVDAKTANFYGTFNGALAGAVTGTLDGDLSGSVFGDDSTLLLDGVNKVFVGSVLSESVQSRNVKLGSAADANIMYLVQNATSNTLSISTENTNGTILLTRNSQVGSANLAVGSKTLRIFNDTASEGTIPVSVMHAHNGTTGSAMGVLRARGTKAVPLAVAIGDTLGAFGTAGYNGAGYKGASGIRSVVDGTPVSTHIPASIQLYNTKSDQTQQVVLSIGTIDSTASFTGPVKLAVFADEAARNAGVTQLQAGMIIFNTTGTKFQGYTGSAWVDLN